MRQQLITILLGQVAEPLRGDVAKPAPGKSAPAYSETTLPRQTFLGQEKFMLDGLDVVFTLKSYPPDVLLIQSEIDVDNIFQQATFDIEEKIYAQAYQILESRSGNVQFCEQYSVFVITNYDGPTEDFLVHAPIIASLLKSERIELDSKEIQYTLDAQIKYAKNDLAIIDWDGAFLFDPEGDVSEDVELLTLANLQLLRHRLLDRQLDHRLTHVARMVPPRKKLLFYNKELSEGLRDVIRTRMLSISEMQRIDREIKFIGDWYSARFYNLAVAKFRIEDWRKSIQSKLESLEDAFSVVVENFTVSGKHRAEWIQIIAFFFLQIGWLLIIVLEFIQLTRYPH